MEGVVSKLGYLQYEKLSENSERLVLTNSRPGSVKGI